MKKTFHSQILSLLFVLSLFCGKAVAGGIPTYDAVQDALSMKQLDQLIEQVTTLKSQLDTQIKQLEDMVNNSIAPAAWQIKEAQESLRKLNKLQEMINGYDSQFLGRIEQYKDPQYWIDNSSAAYEKKMQEQAQKDRFDELGKRAEAMKEYQTKLQQESARLEDIQSSYAGAKGRMEALQYANELAAMQNQQLLEMRTFMMEQDAVRRNEAQRKAEEEALLREQDIRARGLRRAKSE